MTRTLQIFLYENNNKKGKSKQKNITLDTLFPASSVCAPQKKEKTECEEASSLDTNKCRDVGCCSKACAPAVYPRLSAPNSGSFPRKMIQSKHPP